MLVPNFVKGTRFVTVVSIHADGPFLLFRGGDDVNGYQFGRIAESLDLIRHRENPETTARPQLQNAFWFPAPNDFAQKERSFEIRRKVAPGLFL